MVLRAQSFRHYLMTFICKLFNDIFRKDEFYEDRRNTNLFEFKPELKNASGLVLLLLILKGKTYGRQIP